MMVWDKAIEVIHEVYESLYSRYQFELETSIKGSDFILFYINLLQYKCDEINLKRVGSNTDFS